MSQLKKLSTINVFYGIGFVEMTTKVKVSLKPAGLKHKKKLPIDVIHKYVVAKMAKKTNILLESAGFICADGKPISGLIPVNDYEAFVRLSIDEQAVIYEARSLEKIDYVFFRRFADNRSSHIAAYIVDNSDERFSNDDLCQLHRQVWLQGKTPLLYIAWQSKIDILACAREPDFWDERNQKYRYEPAKEIVNDLFSVAGQISDELKQFSAFRLADGTFWDSPDNKELANHDKAAHQSLISAIVELDGSDDIDGKNNPFQRRLLLLMVLIKYLEDRKVFPDEKWFDGFHNGARSFLDVLKSGEPKKVYSLLEALARKFNGDVFDISKINQEKFSSKSLKKFAVFVEAKTIKNQKYLWGQYSFEHLPVEIISHIYQRFIKDGHGAIYTPPFLASLLLDHSLPYNKLTGNERVLDPACGSGIFLVGAFKRLINFWKSKNSWKNPSVKILKEKLKNCVFGIDLDPTAIDLTAFSLSLAVCDALQPKVIWNELKFNRLRDSNLIENDFFELLLDYKNGSSNIFREKFDLIIGNPPFESVLTNPAKEIDKVEKNNNPERGNCPDNQTAYLFLEQSLELLRPKIGITCMIQPSGFLYNRNPFSFRTRIFKNHQTNVVFDFTSVRNLYEANKQTVAILICPVKPKQGHLISHLTFRRTISVKERICFELDHYDFHRVKQDQAITNFYIWRINLLGGGRLIDISKRFREMPTLEQYVNKHQWTYSEGFTVGNKKNYAPFLNNKKYFSFGEIDTRNAAREKISIMRESYFERPRAKELYEAPLMLFKKTNSLYNYCIGEGFLAFSHDIVGIHAPKNETQKLLKVHKFIKENISLYQFLIAVHGSSALTERETAILKKDIDNIPFPNDEELFKTSFWETILYEDVLNYMAGYIRHGQNSELLRNAAKEKDINQYSVLFVKMLASIYDNLKADNPIFLNGLICQPFYFGDKPEIQWNTKESEKDLEKLIYDDKHAANLRTIRIFRYYDKNVLLIVKPNRLRYWIRSTAIRDADETLIDLYNQGY